MKIAIKSISKLAQFNSALLVLGLALVMTFAPQVVSQEQVQEPVYIDVRTWVEHKVDHIQGDPRIHVSELGELIQQQYPDVNTPIRLYCRSGVRSGNGVNILKQLGYVDVANVGGINDARKVRGIE